MYKTESQWLLAFFLLLAGTSATARDRISPDEWLERMSAAVATINYEGTVIRRQNGEAQALKVVHKVVDGVVNEKVITQEGNGLEIIRIGNEVHCILPDKKSVLVEQWNDRSTLFSTLPSSEVSFGSEYDLSLVREERVAGRPAVLLAIRPHDSLRFGHRVWLDRETAFPLRTELIGTDGEPIEQFKFADISLGSTISEQSLAPSLSLDNFTWYSEPQRVEAADIETDWTCDDLPAGFRVISTKHEKLPGAVAPVTHIVYGDGLATVSVFIAGKQEQEIARRSSIGASSSFSLQTDDYQITAVGEVPAETVQRIASSMRQE
ncbi:MAG TPA: MucB/RseB C-terminal domain-containing protein [Woeseiaceae bacterium]|nr:MucB/RseB C-terminal domain-containing protein [Woeseiaceae bacterium]